MVPAMPGRDSPSDSARLTPAVPFHRANSARLTPAVRTENEVVGAGYCSAERIANAQSNVPVTDPHSTSSTYQSFASPAHRRIVSMADVHTWHDFTVLIRPSANMLEKWTSQNWCSSTCSHECVCS